MAAAINSLSLLRYPVRAIALRATLTSSRGSVPLSFSPFPLAAATTTTLLSSFSSRRAIRTIRHASSPHDEEAASGAAAVNADTGAPTIFDKIIAKEIPSSIVYEDEKVFAFRDINPQAPVHVLIIPKLRDGLTELGKAEERHSEILGHLLYAAKIVAEKEGVVDGFRVVINSGAKGCKISYFSLRKQCHAAL
ncbi:hypothetical protein V2J09_021398 [Rumex salicifolius]